MTVIPKELSKLNSQDFTHEDLRLLPESQGIYGIIDEALGLEYLGITRNLKSRFTNPETGFFDHHYYHLRQSPTPFGLSDHFLFETYLTFWSMDNPWKDIRALERALIRKYHPRGNNRHNPFASTMFWSIHNIIESIGKECDYSLQWEKEYWNPFYNIYKKESRKMWRHTLRSYLQDSWKYDYTHFKSFACQAQLVPVISV